MYIDMNHTHGMPDLCVYRSMELIQVQFDSVATAKHPIREGSFSKSGRRLKPTQRIPVNALKLLPKPRGFLHSSVIMYMYITLHLRMDPSCNQTFVVCWQSLHDTHTTCCVTYTAGNIRTNKANLCCFLQQLLVSARHAVQCIRKPVGAY